MVFTHGPVSLTFHFVQLSQVQSNFKTNTHQASDEGQKGQTGKGCKNQLLRFWPGGSCCTEFEVKEASEEINFLVSNPGAEQQKDYVTEVCLLCTSRQLFLLEKLHHSGQQNFGKTGSTGGDQGKAWDWQLKREIALLIGLLPHHLSNKKPHLPHIHTRRHLESNCNHYPSHTCSLYLQALLFLSSLVPRPCKLCMKCAVGYQSTSGIIFYFQTLPAGG